jgi:hypothetical protein
MMISIKFGNETEILKVARKNEHNFWPVAIGFLDDEFKNKLEHKEITEDKDSKVIEVNSNLFDNGYAKDWIKWRQYRTIGMYGYETNWDKCGKLDYSLLKGKSADWFVSERRQLEAKNATLKADKEPKMVCCEICRRILYKITCNVFKKRVEIGTRQ